MAFVADLFTGGPKPEKVNAPRLEDYENNAYIKSLRNQGTELDARGQALANDYGRFGDQGLARARQLENQDYLRAQANGTAPSLVESVYNRNLQQNALNAFSLASSNQGRGNPTLGVRNTLDSLQAANRAGRADLSIAKLAEQQQAQQLLAQDLAQTRQLDQQNTNSINSAALSYGQLGQGYAGLGNQALGAAMGAQDQANAINAGNDRQYIQNRNSLAGGVLNGAASALTLGALSGSKKSPSGIDRTPAFNQGGIVPGRAQVQGNSPRNDTVNANLSPGEAVIPRSDMTSSKKAGNFIDHLLSQRKSSTQSHDAPGYTNVLQQNQALSKRIAELEKKIKRNK